MSRAPFFPTGRRRRKTLLHIDPSTHPPCVSVAGLDFGIRLAVTYYGPHLLRSTASRSGTNRCQGSLSCVISFLVLKDDSSLLQLSLSSCGFGCNSYWINKTELSVMLRFCVLPPEEPGLEELFSCSVRCCSTEVDTLSYFSNDNCFSWLISPIFKAVFQFVHL